MAKLVFGVCVLTVMVAVITTLAPPPLGLWGSSGGGRECLGDVCICPRETVRSACRQCRGNQGVLPLGGTQAEPCSPNYIPQQVCATSWTEATFLLFSRCSAYFDYPLCVPCLTCHVYHTHVCISRGLISSGSNSSSCPDSEAQHRERCRFFLERQGGLPCPFDFF